MIRILQGDCRDVLKTLADGSVHCVVTSPRNRGQFVKGQHWRPHGRHRERDWLSEQYEALRRSTGDIAKEIGCTDAAILFWLARHDIRRRSISEARASKHWGPAGEANPMFGRRGALNPRYIDGSSPARQRAYVQAEGRAFLRDILARDSYRCRRCGIGNTGPRSLHVHHLRPWAGNADLRFDPLNVATLCRTCHRWVHSRANIGQEWLA